MILKEKAQRWNGDREIQGLLRVINQDDALAKLTRKFSDGNAKKLLAAPLNRVSLRRSGCRMSNSIS